MSPVVVPPFPVGDPDGMRELARAATNVASQLDAAESEIKICRASVILGYKSSHIARKPLTSRVSPGKQRTLSVHLSGVERLGERRLAHCRSTALAFRKLRS